MGKELTRAIVMTGIVELCTGSAMVVGYGMGGGWSGAFFAFVMVAFIQLFCLEVANIESGSGHQTGQSPAREKILMRQTLMELRNEIMAMQQKVGPVL